MNPGMMFKHTVNVYRRTGAVDGFGEQTETFVWVAEEDCFISPARRADSRDTAGLVDKPLYAGVFYQDANVRLEDKLIEEDEGSFRVASVENPGALNETKTLILQQWTD